MAIKKWKIRQVYIFSIKAKKQEPNEYMSIENLKVTNILKRKILDHLSFL